uniref:Sperm-activating peptide SAP-IV n=1 Tax=Diadema setosum TaxID=31175 RepID=Q7M4D5_DIASE
GCPWGGAVC